MVTPPSITNTCPVVKLPAGLARKIAAPAISSGSPMRGSGLSFTRLARTAGSSHKARAKSVLTRPGAMQLARMFFPPHSTAMLRVSAVSAALLIP